MEELHPGDPFLYMKVGVHASETLEDILIRKRKEIKDAGVAFWGYGGNTCHPIQAVQPFVREQTDKGLTVRLLMQEINSRHFAEPVPATHYSADGVTWLKVPKGVNVLGSRYALVLSTLDAIDLPVSLEDSIVGVGKRIGSPGAKYIRGHVDKACLVYQPTQHPAPPQQVHLKLSARMADPYAVLLKTV